MMSVLERFSKECPRCHGDIVLIDDVSEGTRTFMALCPNCLYGSSPACSTSEQALRELEDAKEIMRSQDELRRNRG